MVGSRGKCLGSGPSPRHMQNMQQHTNPNFGYSYAAACSCVPEDMPLLVPLWPFPEAALSCLLQDVSLLPSHAPLSQQQLASDGSLLLDWQWRGGPREVPEPYWKLYEGESDKVPCSQQNLHGGSPKPSGNATLWGGLICNGPYHF